MQVWGSGVRVAPCSGTPYQNWQLIYNYRKDAWQIKNGYSGRCLDLKDWNLNDGAVLQTWTCKTVTDVNTWNQYFLMGRVVTVRGWRISASPGRPSGAAPLARCMDDVARAEDPVTSAGRPQLVGDVPVGTDLLG